MEPRTSATRMLLGIGLTDLTFRTSQVALPLVVLAATGSPAATGLVGGAAGLPVLLSPWWTRRLRHRVRSGRAIAACYLVEALALAVVAFAAASGRLDLAVLGAAGLLLGSAEALDGPGRDSLLADLGDRTGVDRALALLTVRDLMRRVSMVVGPAIGGALVARGLAVPLLWAEVVSVVVSAALTVGVGASNVGPADADSAPGIWQEVRRRPAVLRGWVVRGTGCALWFGFTLGLAVLGTENGHRGADLAVGMTAYGVGSALGTAGVLRLLRVLPVLPAISGAWAVTGASWWLIGATGSVVVVAMAAFVSGLAVVVGNAGVTAQITRGSAGDARRTLMTGQNVVVNAASSLGLLVGGPVLVALGARTTLELTGAAALVVALAALVGAPRGQPKRAATSAARAPYPPPNRAAWTSSGCSWCTPTRSVQPSASGETSS